MLVRCARCDKKIETHQSYEHQGNSFCEECYMGILSPPRACDPWAVYSAQTFLKNKDRLSTLTPLQRNMVDFVKGKGEASMEEMRTHLCLTEEELRREFAVLRHMEVLRATKKDGKVVYTLF